MADKQWINAGSVTELMEKQSKVISGGIAVFYHEQEVYAVDNRCPHMGFPLHTGTLSDGMLTCHWHHARFDVCSGGTLDPWADDIPVYEVKLEQDQVWVNRESKTERTEEKLLQRLRDGMSQNISLVIAKAVVALVKSGVSEMKIAEEGLQFGTENRRMGWSSGFTILSAMVNILPKLEQYERILALYHGLRHIASDCSGSAPRFLLQPLPETNISQERLMSWYRQCIEVRDTQGAERVLLTSIEQQVGTESLTEMMLTAVTDHFYLDGGHTFDFHNKAFEMMERVDLSNATRTLASLVPLLQNPSRAEESHNWQHPINLVQPLKQAFEQLNNDQNQLRLNMTSATDDDLDEQEFVQQLLSDRPIETVERLTQQLLGGSSPVKLARLIALAAAERIARFHTQNDFGDWIAVLHTYTHAHAVHESLRRAPNFNALRALYYAAMRIYLDRFLNLPAAKAPSEEKYLAKGYSMDVEELLEIMNERQQVTEAANWVFHYLSKDGDLKKLFNTLAHAVLREDANFHTYQMLEAALIEYDRWDSVSSDLADAAKRTTLLALTRYVAAHAPTDRETSHTATIAWRLQQGEALFEE